MGTEASAKETNDLLNQVSESLTEKQTEISGFTETGPAFLRDELRPLWSRLAACRRTVAQVKESAKSTRDKIDKEAAGAAKQKESAAAAIVRKAINKIRLATQENFEEMKAAVEAAQQEQLANLGSMADKVAQEVEK